MQFCIILIYYDEAFKKKKVCLQRSSQFVPKKITIAKISITDANCFKKIHDKSPTELGMKKMLIKEMFPHLLT